MCSIKNKVLTSLCHIVVLTLYYSMNAIMQLFCCFICYNVYQYTDIYVYIRIRSTDNTNK